MGKGRSSSKAIGKQLVDSAGPSRDLMTKSPVPIEIYYQDP